MRKTFWVHIVTLLGIISCSHLYSQCTGCTTTYASSTGANITVSSGQVICINPGVTMSGQVMMNGGTLCNRGNVTNLRLSSGRGTVKNYGVVRSTEASINFGGSVNIYAFDASVMEIQASSISTSATMFDSLFICVYNGGKVWFQNDLPVSGKRLSIYNGMTDPSYPTNTNNAYFEVTKSISVNNSDFIMHTFAYGISTVDGSIIMNGTKDKTVRNYGDLIVGGNLNTGGSGGPTTSILVENYQKMEVAGTLSTNISPGIFNLKNVSGGGPGLDIGHDLVLNTGTDYIENSGTIKVQQNIDLSHGTVRNNDSLKVTNNFSVNPGTQFLNNNVHKAKDLVVASGGYVFIGGLVDLSNDFINNGKVKLYKQALLKCDNYYNMGADSIIGPSPVGLVEDEYARIWIKNYSKNTGYLVGGILISDENVVLPGTPLGTGFNDVTNPTYIGPYISWVTISNGVTVTYDPVKGKRFLHGAVASSTHIPCGVSMPVTLTANPGVPYFPFATSIPGLYQLYAPVYTWNPGGMTGQSVVVYPTATTTYDVSYTTPMASYLFQITVTVAQVAVGCGFDTKDFAISDEITLNGVVGGGTAPYTFNWQPNAFFSSSTTYTDQNPKVTPLTSLCYTLTITDHYGCHGTCISCLTAQPYAHFNKLPDGGYYKLFENKLLFKYDGQYAETNLNCTIYDKTNTAITSGSFSSLVVNSGDNRYYYNATPLIAGYYTMEVTNEKNEKLYLRFKR